MLVLTRKSGESICIGDNITIQIVKLGGNRVRIGIDAPQEVSIIRSELTSWDDESTVVPMSESNDASHWSRRSVPLAG